MEVTQLREEEDGQKVSDCFNVLHAVLMPSKVSVFLSI